MTISRPLLASALSLGLFGALGLGAARSASADAEPFTLTVQAPPAKAGQPATAKVEIKPAAGFHINKEFPISLKLTAPAGLDLPKPMLKKSDADHVAEEGATFSVAYTPKEAGKKTIDGTLSFAVCSATSCDPRRAKVSIPVDAK